MSIVFRVNSLANSFTMAFLFRPSTICFVTKRPFGKKSRLKFWRKSCGMWIRRILAPRRTPLSGHQRNAPSGMNKLRVCLEGTLAKFSRPENDDIRHKLLQTHPNILVDVSTPNTFWGISKNPAGGRKECGYWATNSCRFGERCRDFHRKSELQSPYGYGRNWNGVVLMEVRKNLMEELVRNGGYPSSMDSSDSTRGI